MQVTRHEIRIRTAAACCCCCNGMVIARPCPRFDRRQRSQSDEWFPRRFNWDGHWSWSTDRRVGCATEWVARACPDRLWVHAWPGPFRQARLLSPSSSDLPHSRLLFFASRKFQPSLLPACLVNLLPCHSRPSCAVSVSCCDVPSPNAVRACPILSPPPSRPTLPRTGTDLAATLRPRSDSHPRRLSYASHPFTLRTPSLHSLSDYSIRGCH